MTPNLDLIGIVVADMAASVAFHRRLGLDIPDGAERELHGEVTLPGGLRLAWDTEEVIRSFMPEWRPPSGSSRTALVFRCADAPAVDRTYADLVGAGDAGAREPVDGPWGQRYAVVHDPDGNAVDLFAPLAG
ncbi:MAG: VOC family protein [Micromonosporaceae bacterium]|jgi:catechol 2,3-dioxygenase-like lactoylglutathione lyase family enzyme